MMNLPITTAVTGILACFVSIGNCGDDTNKPPPPRVEPAPPPAAPGPPPPTGPPPDPTKAIQKVDGNRFRLGSMEFDQKKREIRFPGKVNMQEGLLEYVIVHESGKVHESLLTTSVKPFELNVVLLLLNWKKSNVFFDESRPEPQGTASKAAENPAGSHVDVFVEWKETGGQTQTTRVEDWVRRTMKEDTVKKGPFIYTGSIVAPDGTFIAEQSGCIVSLYADRGCILNNPREGNEDDEGWEPAPKVPPKGTTVSIILKAPEQGEKDK